MLIYILVLIFSFIIFLKTASYGIYEIREHKNSIGGATIIIISIVSLILPNIMMFIRGKI